MSAIGSIAESPLVSDRLAELTNHFRDSVRERLEAVHGVVGGRRMIFGSPFSLDCGSRVKGTEF